MHLEYGLNAQTAQLRAVLMAMLRNTWAGFALAMLAAVFQSAHAQVNAGPYVPTPQYIVDRMLQMAGVGPADYVIDLGSGDGRIVVTAAKRFGARGLGVDIDDRLVELSNQNAQKEGVGERARFEQRDVFKTDISAASVVTLYLLPQIVLDLRPKILSEVRPGTRIVAHDYALGEWEPDDQVTLDTPEKRTINGASSTTLYYYVVPARIAGSWRVKLPEGLGATSADLSFEQTYQKIEGSVGQSGRAAPLRYATLKGERITFAMPVAGVVYEFDGRVNGDQLVGTVAVAGKGRQPFTAARATAAKATGWP